MRVWIFCFTLSALSAIAAPSLNRVQPMAVIPGKTMELTVNGDRFSDSLQISTSFPAKIELVKRTNAKQAIIRINVPQTVSAQVGAIRVYDATGISQPMLLLIDSLATVTTISTDKNKPAALAWPVAVESQTPNLASHWWSIDARKGQRISIETYAARIGSGADPMIRLLDPTGREVAYADDDNVRGSDAALIHEARLTGTYRIELRDVLYRGGQQYRLRVGKFAVWPAVKTAGNAVSEREPNDAPAQATPFQLGQPVHGNIEKPGATDHFQFNGRKDDWLTVHARGRRLGFPAYPALELLDSKGSRLAATGSEVIQQTYLRHRLPADGKYTLRVTDFFRQGGSVINYRLDAATAKGGLTVRLKPTLDAKKKPLPLPDRLWAIAGQSMRLSLQVDRHNFDGPVSIVTANGWAVLDNVLKEKAKKITVQIKVPSDATAGDLHGLNLVAKAEGVPDARLDLEPVYQGKWKQMAIVPVSLLKELPLMIVEPVALSMAATKVKAGAKVKVRVNTRRAAEPVGQQPARKPIVLTLKNMPQGVSAPAKLEVPADKEFLEFELTASPEAKVGKVQISVSAKGLYRGTDWTRESSPVELEVIPK